VNAIQAGARGYLLKDDGAEEISRAIHRLLDGESPISPAIARHLIAHFQKRAPSQTDVTLSSREQDVLNFAAKGYTYAEIAELINVTPNTVGTYTKRIYSKLEVNSKAAAVYEARRLGLMDD
jgi:DNA-binding NarL/FixJ family response regulator